MQLVATNLAHLFLWLTCLQSSAPGTPGVRRKTTVSADKMRAIIDGLPADADGERRFAWQRTTLYAAAGEEREKAAAAAGPLLPVTVG